MFSTNENPLTKSHPQTSNQPLASLPMVGLITTPLKTQIAHFPLQFKVHNKFIETEWRKRLLLLIVFFSATKLTPSLKNSFPNQKNVYAKSEN